MLMTGVLIFYFILYPNEEKHPQSHWILAFPLLLFFFCIFSRIFWGKISCRDKYQFSTLTATPTTIGILNPLQFTRIAQISAIKVHNPNWCKWIYDNQEVNSKVELEIKIKSQFKMLNVYKGTSSKDMAFIHNIH